MKKPRARKTVYRTDFYPLWKKSPFGILVWKEGEIYLNHPRGGITFPRNVARMVANRILRALSVKGKRA